MRTLTTLCLAAASALAFAGPVLAQVADSDSPDGQMQVDAATKTKGVAGIVTSSGAIAKGVGFSVTHNSAGSYTLSFPANSFPYAPAMTCSSWGGAGSCTISNEQYNISTPTTFTVHLYNLAGTATDDGFQFITVMTGSH